MLSLCFRSFGLAAFVLALAACGPTPDPWEVVTGPDCVWEINAYVWLDENANGIEDEGEEPLPGIKVNAVTSRGSHVTSATSGAVGRAILHSWIPCQYDWAFQVYPEIPPGHRLTTASPVVSSWIEQADVQFGFIRDDNGSSGWLGLGLGLALLGVLAGLVFVWRLWLRPKSGKEP